MATISRHRLRLSLLLLADAAMLCMEIWALRIAWRDSGVSMLRYFTNESNLLALAVCGIDGLVTAWTMWRGREKRPAWAKLLRYITASCLLLTFLVTLCISVPMNSGGTWSSFWDAFAGFMLQETYLCLHTLCPVVLFFSFALLEPSPPLSRRHTLLPALLVLGYGIVTLCLVGIGRYEAPYPFLNVHGQSIYATVLWCVGLFGFAWCISLATVCCNRWARRIWDDGAR